MYHVHHITFALCASDAFCEAHPWHTFSLFGPQSKSHCFVFIGARRAQLLVLSLEFPSDVDANVVVLVSSPSSGAAGAVRGLPLVVLGARPGVGANVGNDRRPRAPIVRVFVCYVDVDITDVVFGVDIDVVVNLFDVFVGVLVSSATPEVSIYLFLCFGFALGMLEYYLLCL